MGEESRYIAGMNENNVCFLVASLSRPRVRWIYDAPDLAPFASNWRIAFGRHTHLRPRRRVIRRLAIAAAW